MVRTPRHARGRRSSRMNRCPKANVRSRERRNPATATRNSPLPNSLYVLDFALRDGLRAMCWTPKNTIVEIATIPFPARNRKSSTQRKVQHVGRSTTRSTGATVVPAYRRQGHTRLTDRPAERTPCHGTLPSYVRPDSHLTLGRPAVQLMTAGRTLYLPSGLMRATGRTHTSRWAGRSAGHLMPAGRTPYLPSGIMRRYRPDSRLTARPA